MPKPQTVGASRSTGMWREGNRRPFPIVAGHGFAGTRLIWDLTPETSMARYLAKAGYDFYAVDLRGRGESWPKIGPRADSQWSFDDFVERDLPAAVAKACERSGVEEAFWLGLEMSGQALYASVISGTANQVRAGITFGSPVLTPLTARVPGVTTQPQMRRHGRVKFRAGARFAGPILALTKSKQLESSFRPQNFDPIGPARYLYNGIPDEATVLADQFGDWIEHGVMRSLDYTTVWSDHLGEINLPLLIMAAAHDLQRPPEASRATFEAIGSSDKTWVEAGDLVRVLARLRPRRPGRGSGLADGDLPQDQILARRSQCLRGLKCPGPESPATLTSWSWAQAWPA